jgi:hypothetical protein
MPYMPGTGYLVGFKQKTMQASMQPTLVFSEPKISTLVATTLPSYQEMGEIGAVSSPLIVAQPVQVLQGAGPLGIVGGIFRAVVPTIPAIVRAVTGTFAKVIPGFATKLGPVLGPKAKAITVKEILGTGVKTTGAVLGVKEVVDVIGPTAAGIATQAIAIGADIYKDLSGYELGPGGNGMAHPSAGTSIAIRPSGPTGMGIMPGGDQIVKTWHANGIPFWRTLDGWIYVQRKDGTVKRYRPYKSVVLGKKPSSKQINRAINKLKREDKTYHKLTRLFHKPTRSKSAH